MKIYMKYKFNTPWQFPCRRMKYYRWNFRNVKFYPNILLHHMKRLDKNLQILFFHPKLICSRALFLFSKNVCSFSFARSKNSANSGDGLNDLFISLFSERYKPFCVLVLKRTTCSQFLKSPPWWPRWYYNHALTHSDNVCPFVASFKFIGSCAILHLNSYSTAMHWGFA